MQDVPSRSVARRRCPASPPLARVTPDDPERRRELPRRRDRRLRGGAQGAGEPVPAPAGQHRGCVRRRAAPVARLWHADGSDPSAADEARRARGRRRHGADAGEDPPDPARQEPHDPGRDASPLGPDRVTDAAARDRHPLRLLGPGPARTLDRHHPLRHGHGRQCRHTVDQECRRRRDDPGPGDCRVRRHAALGAADRSRGPRAGSRADGHSPRQLPQCLAAAASRTSHHPRHQTAHPSLRDPGEPHADRLLALPRQDTVPPHRPEDEHPPNIQPRGARHQVGGLERGNRSALRRPLDRSHGVLPRP